MTSTRKGNTANIRRKLKRAKAKANFFNSVQTPISDVASALVSAPVPVLSPELASVPELVFISKLSSVSELGLTPPLATATAMVSLLPQAPKPIIIASIESATIQSSSTVYSHASSPINFLNQNKNTLKQSSLEQQELNTLVSEYVMVDEVKSENPYGVFHLQTLLKLVAEENGLTKENEWIDDNYFGFAIKLYRAGDKTVALFDVVKDTNEMIDLNGTELKPLQEALTFFKDQALKADLLLIPIGCLVRNHYRLLEINLKTQKAAYYDSKSTLVRLVAAAPASIIESYLVLSKTQEATVNAVAEQVIDLSLLEAAEAYLAKAKEIFDVFYKSFNYVNDACLSIWENIQIQAVSLAHQTMLNHVDCGVYLVEYVDFILQNKPIAVVDASVARLKHQELFQKESFDQEEYLGLSYR